MLITPSGMGAEGLTEDDIVFVQMDGTVARTLAAFQRVAVPSRHLGATSRGGRGRAYAFGRGDRAGLYAHATSRRSTT